MAGNNLFKAKIAETIAKAFKGLLLTGTLEQYTSQTRNPTNLAGGTQPTLTASITFEGVISEFKDDLIDNTIIQRDDRKVVMLAESFSTKGVIPDMGDKITIEGNTYFIVGPVKRDPDKATFTCHVRA